jgi:hypothetical protein
MDFHESLRAAMKLPDGMSETADCYASMGALIFAFQSLESELLNLCCEMIDSNTPNLPRILTTSLSFKRILDVLGGLSKERLKDKLDLFDKLQVIITESLQHEENRNRYVHSHYDLRAMDFISDKVLYGQEKHKVKFKTGYSFQSEEFDPKKVFDICNGIRGTIGKLLEVSQEIIMHLYPDRFGPEYEDWPET